jgi:hypothetical protein
MADGYSRRPAMAGAMTHARGGPLPQAVRGRNQESRPSTAVAQLSGLHVLYQWLPQTSFSNCIFTMNGRPDCGSRRKKRAFVQRAKNVASCKDKKRAFVQREGRAGVAPARPLLDKGW